MTIVDGGYVKLEKDIPARMRFNLWREEIWDIRDPATKNIKKQKVLIMHCTELDGNPVDLPYSTVSVNHMAALRDLIRTGTAFMRVIQITLHPIGRATEYEIRVL